jgi:hypothetical protein
VAEQLRKLGCDPIEEMAILAQDTMTPQRLRARLFTDLTGYVVPKRKAIELSGPGGQPIQMTPHYDYSELTTEECDTLAMLLRKAGFWEES